MKCRCESNFDNQKRPSIYNRQPFNFISRTKPKTALKSEGFTCEILEVGICKLNTSAAYILFGISKVSRRWSVHVLGKCFGICLLEVFKLCSPCEGANHVDVDAVLAPFCRRNSAKTSDSLFSCRIRALTEVAEKSGTRCKVNYTTLCFFEIGVASLHVMEGCIKSGV